MAASAAVSPAGSTVVGSRPAALESVGGKSEKWKIVPTLVAAAYASGDTLGTDAYHTLTNAVRFPGGSGIIQSCTLVDLAAQNVAIDAVFFAKAPSNTTFTDNAALDIHDTDILEVIGVVSFLAADYAAFADNSLATRSGIGLAFNADSTGRNIFVTLVARGAYTAAGTADLQLTVTILQD